jgi:hypothetical protein
MCMCVYVCMCVCMYVRMYLCVYACIYSYIRMYACLCVLWRRWHHTHESGAICRVTSQRSGAFLPIVVCYNVLSQWRTRFNPRRIQIGFVLRKMAQGQIALQVSWLFKVSYSTLVNINLSSSCWIAGPLNAAIHSTKKTRATISSVYCCQGKWEC